MLRVLILVSLCTVISASIIPSYVLEYPRTLQRLFGAKRETVTDGKKGEHEVCKTEECKQIAKVIKESMDESVDPCDDFYQYACGNWSNFHSIPENKTSWSLWAMVSEKVENQVKEIISSDPEPGDFFAVKLAKNWYRSCMNKEAIEKKGVEPILSTLWRHGGWPLIMEDGEWDENVYNWQIVDDHFARLLGFNAFHDVRYSRLSYEGNDTILIETPHLPIGVERLLSYENYFNTDSSDENNESGEGSQEKGSKEKGQEQQNEESKDEDEDEDNEAEDDWNTAEEEEKGQESKRIATRRNSKRLGHAGRRHDKNRATSSHVGKTRKRNRRDALKQRVHHRMLHHSKKAKTHNVRHNGKGKLSKHAYLSHYTSSATKRHSNGKRIGKHSKSEINEKKNNNKRKKIGNSDDDEEEEEQRKKKMSSRKVASKRSGHGKKKNEKRKGLRTHVHGRKLKKKSHSIGSKAKVHATKHVKHQKMANHGVHRHARKMSVSEHRKMSLANSTDDTSIDTDDENRVSNEEENDDNKIDTNDDKKDEDEEGNEIDNDEEKEGNEKDNDEEKEEDEKDNDEEKGENETDNDEDAEENETNDEEEEEEGDEQEEEGKVDDDDENSDGDDDDKGDDNDDEDEDEEDEEDKEEERQRLKGVYREHILNISLVLSKGRGIEIPKEKMLRDIDDLIEFTIKLGELTLIEEEPTPMTLKELQQYYNKLGPITNKIKINWVRKVEKLFAEAGVEIEDDVDITVKSLEYIEKLRALLEETPSKVIVNYIHWLFVNKAVLAGTEELRELSEKWTAIFKFETRESLCIELVQLTNVAGYEYVKKYFSEDIAKSGRDMIDDIQKEVEYQIKGATWMNNDTKHFILDKLVHMKNWIGYPEWYQNTTLVKRFFQGLTLGPSFYENLLNYIRYARWKSLRRAVDNDLDDELNTLLDPLELNAFFMPTENSISLTAADFQSPFFAYNRPWYVNFGIVGLIMGHEINHGFDDSGHLYDREGNQMEWLSAMAEAYDKRAECFVDQYNKYSIIRGENYTIENYGNQTAGENIADTMGLQAVFKAYKRRERECGKPDPALPGLEKFTNDQAFFLSFATVWCEKIDRESAISSAKHDVHSTERLRVIGSVSNSQAFAKAFNCPVGSPMNPANKCNIWE